jgi:predicted DCC family thiol-disulfide oxidoreductase YuxK
MDRQTPASVSPPVPSAAAEKAQVFYDGDCALCRKSVEQLRRLDVWHRLTYVNVRTNPALPTCQPPLDPGRLLQEMHLVTPDGRRMYHGFGAFRWMAWRLPLLWPLAPFLYLPGVATLGQHLYLWIARNRFRLVPCHGGVCTVPDHKPLSRQPTHRS